MTGGRAIATGTPSTTRWAIAAKLPIEALKAVRATLPKVLRGDLSKIVQGDKGFGAILVFGENAAEGESAAARLAADSAVPVYLLDFDDDAPSITEIAKGRERRKRGHPADFLENRGIIAPGFAATSWPIASVGVIEDLTPTQARKLAPKSLATSLQPHARGTLVTSNGFDAVSLALRAKRRAYIVAVDPNDGSFRCNIVGPEPKTLQFAPTKPNVNFEQVDSVLGETTLEGILRVLDIPRELLP